MMQQASDPSLELHRRACGVVLHCVSSSKAVPVRLSAVAVLSPTRFPPPGPAHGSRSALARGP